METEKNRERDRDDRDNREETDRDRDRETTRNVEYYVLHKHTSMIPLHLGSISVSCQLVYGVLHIHVAYKQ